MSLEIVAQQCNSVTSTRVLLPNPVDLILNIIECFDGHFKNMRVAKQNHIPVLIPSSQVEMFP